MNNNEERCIDMTPGMPHEAHHHMHQNLMHQLPHDMMAMPCHEPVQAVECGPIIKAPIEKVCHREIHHTVRHIQPIHTRIINRHVYNHCCEPCFTCSEENVVCHVGNSCCK